MIRHSLFGFPGAEFLVRREALAPLWNALSAAVRARGGGPIGYRASNALRLEAGVPWFGTDFDEHQIPHEAALDQTHISYTKGCYTGQEIVERVRSRGHVNRRRTGLAFSGAEPPAAGAKLTAGRSRRSVTSPAPRFRRSRASRSAWVTCGASTISHRCTPAAVRQPGTRPELHPEFAAPESHG